MRQTIALFNPSNEIIEKYANQSSKSHYNHCRQFQIKIYSLVN